MTGNGVAQIVFYLVVLTALTPPLGAYIARVYEGRRIPVMSAVLGPVERLTYRTLRIDEKKEQGWKSYATAVLAFSVASFALLYAILRLQGHLPLNPNDYPGMSWFTAFNTAASFVTNTNWQFYGGESTLSYLSQMTGLTVQNFVSAAVGMAVLAAVIRGFARRGAGELGNFWADLVRVTLYVLLPLAIVVGIFLGTQGVIQTLSDPVSYQTLEARTLGATDDAGAPATQSIYRGPAASQIAIKQIGTNGGGYWNANSAVPFENPTPLTNFVEMLLILLIPAALTYTFGIMVGSRRAGVVPVRGDDGDARRGDLRRGAVRAARRAGAARHRGRAVGVGRLGRRQHERQGGALRHHRLGALGHGHHRGLERVGEQRPRRLDRRGRGRPAHPDGHGGGGVRRRRLGALRDAAVRRARGVRGGPDGGPHARVPGQEDRRPRDQAHDDRRARHAGGPADHARRGPHHRRRDRVDLQQRPAGLRRGVLRLHLPVQQQRQRLRRLRGDRAVGDAGRRRDADRPLRPDPRRPRAGRGALGQAGRPLQRRDPAHHDADVRGDPALRDRPGRRARRSCRRSRWARSPPSSRGARSDGRPWTAPGRASPPG